MACDHDGEQHWTRLGKSLDLRHNVYEVKCAACPVAWLHTGEPPGVSKATLDAGRLRLLRLLPPLDAN